MVENGSANGTVTADSLHNGGRSGGGKCSRRNEEERRGEESRESLLCSLIWIARCAARPRSFARRARANLPFFPSTPPPPAAGSDPIETRAARLPWRRRCRAAASSQIPMQCQPTATPQSAHMNEQRERNFPSKRIQEVGVGERGRGTRDTSLHEISTLLDPFLSRPSHEQCSSAAEDSFVHVSRQRIESWPFLLSASVRPSVMAVGPLLALGSAASAQHVRRVRFSSCGRRWHESRSNLASSSRPPVRGVRHLSSESAEREGAQTREPRFDEEGRKEGIILDRRTPHERIGNGHE